MISMFIGLVLVWISGLLAGQILFARPEIERTKDWEFLAEWWQEKYWTEFRKHNDDERFSVPNIPDEDVMTTDSIMQPRNVKRKDFLDSIVPEYENQR